MHKEYDFIAYLNEYQKEAVLDEHKALIVNAHVGSGKTTVLISKVLYLSVEKGIDFRDMVVLTFTNKAANEIKERIKHWFPDIQERDMPYIGTFHSIANALLKNVLPVETLGYTSEFTIIDPDELEEMANRLIIEYGMIIKYQNKLTRRIEELKKARNFSGI